MKKITIVVVDDHKLVRQMLSVLLTKNDIEIKGESGNLEEAIEMIKIQRPDIVLLDINFAEGSGMDAVPLIRKFSPGTRIIAVSLHKQPMYVKKMLQLGAKAYVTKNSAPEELLKAVHEVMEGRIYVCTEIKDILTGQAMTKMSGEPSINNLSVREIEIIKHIKEGLSSKEISTQLVISARTVEVHRHNILKKLQLKNTASLISFVNKSELSF